MLPASAGEGVEGAPTEESRVLGHAAKKTDCGVAITITRPQGPLSAPSLSCCGGPFPSAAGVTFVGRRCPLRTSSGRGSPCHPRKLAASGLGPVHTWCLFSWKQPMKPHSLSFHSGFRHNSETLYYHSFYGEVGNKTLSDPFSTTQITRKEIKRDLEIKSGFRRHTSCRVWTLWGSVSKWLKVGI